MPLTTHPLGPRLFFALVLICGIGLGSASISQAEDLSSRWGEIFREHEVDGCFVYFSSLSGQWLYHDQQRSETRYLPASTFKLLNSLIALEEGAVADVEETLPWDGQDRGYEPWNQDHSMQSALAVSAVWFYQELARRVGPKQMAFWVEKVGYGNRDVSGSIDSFWLDGGLRISGMEQVLFLQALAENRLPFSKETLEAVRDISIVERTEAYTLHAKTGWAMRVEPQVGWYVGWLEQGGANHFFALNMDIRSRKDARAREPIARKCLQALGLL